MSGHAVRKSLWALVAAAMPLAACVTSHVLTGKARVPVSSGQVRVYLEPIKSKYVEIAVVEASSRYAFSWTAAGQAEIVINRLKKEAARVGANGILLQEVTEPGDRTFGADLVSDHTGAHGSIDLSFGVSGLLSSRFGRAIAVYVEP